MSFEDKSLTCRECGNNFVWTAGEQEFYAQKGLVNVPSRCPDCRKARRAASNSGGGYASNDGGNRQRSSEPRVQHPVTCASCGKETTVPFVPKYDRPVYCSECFEKERGNARPAAAVL